MAGISVVISDGRLPFEPEQLKNLLDSLNYLDDFRSQIRIEENNLFLGWNNYEGYPITEISNKNYLIFLEGKVYNKTISKITKEVEKISEVIESKNNGLLIDWLKETDGDFILYLYSKFNKNFYIINDIFGRIPIYYSNSKGRIIISRHLKFISSLLSGYKFDRIALVQYLLMGFILGRKTLIENINQIEPASLFSAVNGKLNITKLYNFNFENKIHREKSFKENIENISFLYSQSVIYRFKDSEKNILSLSGGLDSRAVAACLFHNGIEYTAVGMRYVSGHEAEDLKNCKEIVRII